MVAILFSRMSLQLMLGRFSFKMNSNKQRGKDMHDAVYQYICLMHLTDTRSKS